MMYILLLVYFVNIVTGDDSGEAKYIDLLPEKEKEDFLEIVARRIFDNIKHKDAIPERDEHTKLIEKVLKEESLNLKRVSQNTSDDNDGNGNEAGEDGDALNLAREGKRNKRNSLKENKNSDIVHVQQTSKDTDSANFNELSKELGVSDTEDIEVKHTNIKQTEINNEETTTKSNVEGIETEKTVRDKISKENSSVRDGDSNFEQEGKMIKSAPSTFKPEQAKDTIEDASESIETNKAPEHSYSTTEKINVISRRNGNSELTNDSNEKYTKQEPVAITVKTSLSTSLDVKFTEPTSKEALEENVTKSYGTNTGIKPTKPEEKNVVFGNTIKKIVITSPKIKATESTTELSKTNETRKTSNKLDSNLDTDNTKLDDISDDRDNQAVIHDKTLTTKTVVTSYSVKLNDNFFDDKSTAAAVDNNQNHISLNDLAVSSKKNYQPVTEKIKKTNSVSDRENKDTKSSETIVNSTENSNETIIKIIKNSKDYIEKKLSIKETAVNNYNGTTLENIIKSHSDIIETTTMDTLINNNKEINIEKRINLTQNKSDGVTDGIHAKATMKSNKMRNDPNIVKTTSKEILIDDEEEIEMKNNTTAVPEINNNETGTSMKSFKMINDPDLVKTTSYEILINEDKKIERKKITAAVPKIKNNKTEANSEEVITESINITIIHDNSVEKNKSNTSIHDGEIRPDKNDFENNEGMTSETHTESTTVKIETLTVATDLNKFEANDKGFRIKEDSKPYINQDKILKTPIPKTKNESVKLFDNDDNKMEKNLEKMEKISANFVNDMIKVIRASFRPSEELKPLRSLDDNPTPKEYKVYQAPNNEHPKLDQNYGTKDDKVIQENPYYVPVYNYGPEYAYYNPKNRLGPNVDDDDVTIIKNDGLNEEAIAHDYDSFVKDNNYNENVYIKNYYENQLDSNDNDARNDVDYDEAYNKERDFIDRMGNTKKKDFKTILNENLRGRDTENTQKLKKVEYMKNLVKIYKNRHSKNRQRSFGKYKLNLPIVVNYPKYSDIIMNSHDYLDVDYRYPTRNNKPKHTRSRKHRILRGNVNKFPSDLIITSFADEPNSNQEDVVGVAKPDDKYNDDFDMFSGETEIQETEKPYKVTYDYDHENYSKKPLLDHYGKPNSINLFDSGEYVWESQDTKEKRDKKQREDVKSLGVKNQIRKIREMMYSTANFGFVKPKQVEEKMYKRLEDFIQKVPKMCDGEDESCVEPFILISNNHLHNKKQTDSARHAMNNSIASDYLAERMNNTSDFVVDSIPKLSVRTKKFRFGESDQIHTTDHIQIKWITDFSEIRDNEEKLDCSFCSNSVCHSCVCGHSYKFCKIPETRPSDVDNNDHDNNDDHHYDHDYDVVMTTPIDDAESNEKPTDEDIPNTTIGWYWDTVKNISMLPSYLDPILEKNHQNGHKENYKKYKKKNLIFRSRNFKLLPETSIKDDVKSQEDNNTESYVAKPNIIKLDFQDELNDPDHALEEYESSVKKIKTIKSVMEIIPEDVEIMLKVTAMLENQNDEEKKLDIEEKEGDIEEKKGDREEQESQFLRSVESLDLQSYVTVLHDMVRNEAKGLVQYDWMGTSIDIQAAIFKLKEMTENVKNNEVLDHLDFKLLKYFTFLHKFSMKRQNDLRMVLPKPKYKYNRTRSERGLYSRTWLKRRLKKFAFEVSGTDLYYFMEFLEELQFYLHDLHTALTQIAMVTSYKNQHWFKNLTELYLDNSRKNILELLLHVTTVRLLDLVEISVQTGLQDGFLKYVIHNEKEIEKSKNELVLILRIIDELKKME